MNLGQYLANILLEAEDQPTIALFPGAFKPPHKGHFDVVEKLLKAADQVVVLVSPKTREGVTADESIAVWNLYKPKFNGSVEIKISSDASPVKGVYNVVEENPDTNFIVAFGKGEMDRYKNIEKYPNVKVFDAGAIEGVSATNLRMALLKKDQEEIAKYLPDGISVDEFLQALNTKPEEKPEEIPAEQPPAETPPTEQPEQPLQESPPIEFEKDAYQDYTLANRRKIEAAAAVFNIPIDDMEFAFNGGTEVVLNDDMWKEMENTKSYNIKVLSDAISHALKIGIDPKPYIDAIKKQDDIPLPLVLQYAQGKYYLVGGEVILSIYRSLGVIPTVLLGTLNLQDKTLPEPLHEGMEKDRSKTIKSFIKYAINELGIQKLPSGLTLSYNNNDAKSMHSFGSFNPNNDKIWLYVKNRNMADILRTLAHELVHRKQAEDGRIENGSGNTGSDIENEANAMAGILLRKFGKQNENIYEGLKKNQILDEVYLQEKIVKVPEEVIAKAKDLYNYIKSNIKKIEKKGIIPWDEPYIDTKLKNFFQLKDLKGTDLNVTIGLYNDPDDAGSGRMDTSKDILLVNLPYLGDFEDFEDTVEHELVHAMDPKVRDVKLFGKLYAKKGAEPTTGGTDQYAKYIKSPWEFDAFTAPLINKLKLGLQKVEKKQEYRKLLIQMLSDLTTKKVNDILQNDSYTPLAWLFTKRNWSEENWDSTWTEYSTEIEKMKNWVSKPTLYKRFLKRLGTEI